MDVDYHSKLFTGIIIEPGSKYHAIVTDIVNKYDEDLGIIYDQYEKIKQRIYAIVFSVEEIYEVMYYSGVNLTKTNTNINKRILGNYMDNYMDNYKNTMKNDINHEFNHEFYNLLQRFFDDEKISVGKYIYTYAT